MPAKAGIQGKYALLRGYASWIPGLALLARNDELSRVLGPGQRFCF
jgi:hypothetical protein